MKLSDVLIDEGDIFERERQQFACLTAFYIGQLSGGGLDLFSVMEKCIKFAKHYDFDIEDPINSEDPEEEILLDADAAREAAYKFAEEAVYSYTC